MSAWLQQAKSFDDYAYKAAKMSAEYAAEGDHLRANRYRLDAIWYSDHAQMYRERHEYWMRSNLDVA